MATKNHHLLRFRPWRSSREIPLTLLSIGWFLVCTFIICFTNAYLDTANPYVAVPVSERKRLPDPLLDVGHRVYGDLLHLPNWLPDPLVRAAPIFMFLRVLVAGDQGCKILRRLGFIIGTGYLIRVPFVLMTLLPSPLLECAAHPTTNLLTYALLMMAQLKSSCGDVLFSGHTIMFVSAALVWTENPVATFSPKLNTAVYWVTVAYAFLGTLSLVVSTYHYTIDCTLSAMVLVFLWKFYHFVVRTHYYDDTLIGKLIIWCDGATRNHPFTLLEADDDDRDSLLVP